MLAAFITQPCWASINAAELLNVLQGQCVGNSELLFCI